MSDFYLYGDIGYMVNAEEMAPRLRAHPDSEPMILRIASYGGDVFEASAIAAAVRDHPAPSTAVVDSVAASAASYIAMAADRVHMAEDAWFMIHNTRGMMPSGGADDLRRQADLMDSLNVQYVEAYARRTGLPEANIRAMMDAETWMDAAQAVDFGFADEITAPAGLIAAHAGSFFDLDRFPRSPIVTRTQGGRMKTKLSQAIVDRLTVLAADDTARDSLLSQIVAACEWDRAALELFLQGTRHLKPTAGVLEAFATVLSLEVNTVRADAAADWPDLAAAVSAQTPAPAAPEPGPNAIALAEAEGQAAERRRQLDIRAQFESWPGQENLMQECINQGLTVEAAGARLLSALGQRAEPSMPASYQVTHDHRDKFREGAFMALWARGDEAFRREHRDAMHRSELSGMTMPELAREACRVAGLSIAGKDRWEIVGLSFTQSDFPNLLADVAHKSLMTGFEEAPETWDAWAQIGNLTDFKPHRRTSLSEFADMQKITGGSEEYKRGEFTDLGQVIVLDTWGRLFSITRQAIINDDQNAFTGIPRGMGRAYSRLVGDLAYQLLINGANHTEDNQNTYHTSHNNTGTAALDGPGLDAGRVAMATQPGILNKAKGGSEGSKSLNIRAAYGIVPIALEATLRGIVADTTMWNNASPGTTRMNVYANMVMPVADPRMDNESATQWILAANPAQHPTVEMGFLNGNPEPRLEQQNQFTTDGVDFKVSGDVGGQVLDWRGLYKSTGTT